MSKVKKIQHSSYSKIDKLNRPKRNNKSQPIFITDQQNSSQQSEKEIKSLNEQTYHKMFHKVQNLYTDHNAPPYLQESHPKNNFGACWKILKRFEDQRNNVPSVDEIDQELTKIMVDQRLNKRRKIKAGTSKNKSSNSLAYYTKEYETSQQIYQTLFLNMNDMQKISMQMQNKNNNNNTRMSSEKQFMINLRDKLQSRQGYKQRTKSQISNIIKQYDQDDTLQVEDDDNDPYEDQDEFKSEKQSFEEQITRQKSYKNEMPAHLRRISYGHDTATNKTFTRYNTNKFPQQSDLQLIKLDSDLDQLNKEELMSRIADIYTRQHLKSKKSQLRENIEKDGYLKISPQHSFMKNNEEGNLGLGGTSINNISDPFSMTNKTLIKRSITSIGVYRKPSQIQNQTYKNQHSISKKKSVISDYS